MVRAFLSIVSLLLLGLAAPLSTRDEGSFAPDGGDAKLERPSEMVVPAVAKDGAVTIVTAETFDNVVMDGERDVLLQLYAPWCGWCKKLSPIYQSLAETLQGIDSLTIANMDATAEKVKGVSANGYPTVRFYPANNKTSPLDYSGERTVEDFLAYLGQHASKPFVAPPITKAPAVMVSEEVRPEDTTGPVTVVRGRSFQKLMDAEANQVPGVEVTGFPTIKFFPAGNKTNPIPFTGSRDLGGFVNFLRAKAATPFELESTTFASEEVLPEDTAGALIEVKGDSFQQLVVANDRDVMIMFYTTWCSHCKTLKPIFEGLANKLAHVPSVVVARMNWEANQVVAPGVEVTNFPTMLFFPANNKTHPIPYTGIRWVSSLVSFIQKNAVTPFKVKPDKAMHVYLSEPVTPEDTADPLVVVKGDSFKDLVMDPSRDVLVEFGAPWCSHCVALEPILTKVAIAARGVPTLRIAKMDATANTVDVPGLLISSYPTVLLFPAMNKANPIPFTGKRQPKAIVDFLKAYSSITFALPDDADLSGMHKSEEVLPEDTKGPLTVVKGKSFHKLVVESDKDVFVKFYAPWCGHCKTMAPEWEKLGKEIKDMGLDHTITIAQIDMTANECDVEVNGYPTLTLFPRGKKSSPIEFPGSERDVKHLLQFLKKHSTTPITITKPEYQVTYKSEEVLPEDTAGPVKVVKGRSFKDLVMDSSKDVFVKVYAPWCGWCKKVAPEWEKLGSAFEGVDSVTIAEIDATANEAEGLKANGFPTFLFYPANDKTPIAFSGERTVADFAAFIKKHASTPFTLDLPEGDKGSARQEL